MKISDCSIINSTYFIYNYPVSPEYIQDQYSSDSKQVESGQSIVIVSPSCFKAYKRPMCYREAFRLEEICADKLQNCRIAFPNDIRKVGDVKMCVFPLYRPSLTRKVIIRSRIAEQSSVRRRIKVSKTILYRSSNSAVQKEPIPLALKNRDIATELHRKHYGMT